MEIKTTLDETCSFCGAPWGSFTVVNRAHDFESLRQIATPNVKYACGTVMHSDDFTEFHVPEQIHQSPECLRAELANYRATKVVR